MQKKQTNIYYSLIWNDKHVIFYTVAVKTEDRQKTEAWHFLDAVIMTELTGYEVLGICLPSKCRLPRSRKRAQDRGKNFPLQGTARRFARDKNHMMCA